MLPFATLAGGARRFLRPAYPAALRRLRMRTRGLPLLPALFILMVLICALFSNWIVPHHPYDFIPEDRLTPPAWTEEGSSKYLLGTDATGRDILSRIIYGARISLIVAAIAISVSAAIGTIIGIISGYFGGWIDVLLMRLVDIVMSMPVFFIALALAGSAIFKPGAEMVISIIVIFGWAFFARIVRGQVLSLKERDFIALARVAQASPWRIGLKHILPNLVDILTVLITLDVGAVILLESGLSFIGFGIQPPMPSWGNMIAEGRSYISYAWWLITFPGLALMGLVFSCNFIGDWLRDHFDPRLRQL